MVKLENMSYQSYYSHRLLVFILLQSFIFISGEVAAADSQSQLCTRPFTDQQLTAVFKQNALKQLALDYGDSKKYIFDLELYPIDPELVRIDAYAKYPNPNPGQKDYISLRIMGWVSRCQGTTIMQGNSWLADGTLIVNRFAASQLPGRGLSWGNPAAPLHFIVFVDSRCPHCHRLISYAAKFVASGQYFIEVRQVAYLESVDEALKESGLAQSSLIIKSDPTVSDEELLERLSGMTGEEAALPDNQASDEARSIVKTNTATAQKILHILTVPGVLIQEKQHNNQYRAAGRREINRYFHAE